MTNAIATVTITLILVTNWTGDTFNGKELGFVATNHVASVMYQGDTNQLKSND
jgi:predicted HAD superfamily hydrolase